MRVPRREEPVSGSISLLKLKEVACQILPMSSTTRSLILAEKDVLSESEALAKFEILDRLLVSELGP